MNKINQVMGGMYGMNIKDTLNLYLVANKLKPASLVIFDTLFDGKHDIRFKNEGNAMDIYEENDIRFNPQQIEEYIKSLDELGIKYHQNDTKDFQTCNENGKPIKAENILFQVGKNKSCLETLLNAKNDADFGLALGYPRKAYEAFGKIIDGEKRDGQYAEVAKAKAKKAGLELPSWLAYISHIPEHLDLVGGNVSKTSQALGEKFRDYVRENNPELAQKIEKSFLSKKLPDSFERTSGGSYSIGFGYNP